MSFQSMHTLRQRLSRLNCPLAQRAFTDEDFTNHDVIIVSRWLEDRVIRYWSVDERSGLHPDDPQVAARMSEYLRAVGCPFPWQAEDMAEKEDLIRFSNFQVLLWLSSYALRMQLLGDENEDDMDIAAQEDNNPNLVTDYSDIEAKLIAIGRSLELDRASNECLTDFVRRISTRVKFSYIGDASRKDGTDSFKLEDFPLGFDSSADPFIKRVAMVLRMLYLSDFRDLQNEVNDLIVIAQEYTANPRLNAAQGKVGR